MLRNINSKVQALSSDQIDIWHPGQKHGRFHIQKMVLVEGWNEGLGTTCKGYLQVVQFHVSLTLQVKSHAATLALSRVWSESDAA